MNCPSRDDWLLCLSGALPAGRMESVFGHAAECPHCQTMVETLDDVFGAVPEAVRSLRSSCAVTPACERMMAAAENVLSECLTEAAPEFANESGRVLRDYQLLEPIGRGGMGVLYRARHLRLNRIVALKVLTAARQLDPAAVGRFQREMEAVGRLEHPNIVRALDAGEHEGVHYLVMELIEGADLRALVKGRGPLPVAEACGIIRQAALALHCAHQHGLVHRDVKPSNLMISPCGQVKLLDLGLALLHGDAGGELSQTIHALGSIDYMAPEQVNDSHDVQSAADFYSLGCTLYYLLAGRPPHAGPECTSLLQRLEAHATRKPPPITDLRAETPPELAELLDRLLAKMPELRPVDAMAVAEALAPFAADADLAQLVENAESSPRSSESDKTQPRRRRKASFVLRRYWQLAMAAGMIVLAALAVWRHMVPSRPAAEEKPEEVAQEQSKTKDASKTKAAIEKAAGELLNRLQHGLQQGVAPATPYSFSVSGQKQSLTVNDHGLIIKINQSPGTGIQVEVTEHIDGQESVKQFRAKDADELVRKHQDAWRFFIKHTRPYMRKQIIVIEGTTRLYIDEASGLDTVVSLTRRVDGQEQTRVYRGRQPQLIEIRHRELAGLYRKYLMALSSNAPGGPTKDGARCLIHTWPAGSRTFVIDEANKRYQITAATTPGILSVRVSQLDNEDAPTLEYAAKDLADLKRKSREVAAVYEKFSGMASQVDAPFMKN